MGTWIKDKVFANADDFLTWLDKEFGDYITQHISEQHTHHTWSPNHSHYPKYTTLQLHKNMRNVHVNTNGWSDIAQNITIGKDGDIVTGRDIRQVPVSATGHNGSTNWHPFAYEMIGNFDVGNDKLEGKQLESAIKISNYFYKKNKPIKFHRELLLPNGKVPKTCPGTGVDKNWFMGLVKNVGVVTTQNGWVKKTDKWYFYKNNTLVKNDWAQDSKKLWYYLGEDGCMQVSKWVKWKNNWYYLNADGSMKTGWIDYKGKKYFLAANGEMVTGFYCIDKVWYLFGVDGDLQSNIDVDVKSVKVNSDGSISKINK